MPTITPTSTTWTLRCKHHKTTVLLHADALQTLSSLRAELLHALRETHPDGVVAGKPLPAAAEDLQLAKLQDATDPDKGWVLLSSVATAAAGNNKGKGKSGAGGEGSLKAAGLKDNAVLAFRWGEDAEVAAAKEDVEGMEIEEEAAGEWDVVWPTYEDTYMDGLEDEGIAE